MTRSACLLLVGVLFLYLPDAKAQILTGPLLGGQATNVRYSSLYEGLDFRQNYSLNYFGGWSYTYEAHENLGFHSELYYSRKGKAQRYDSDFTRVVEHRNYFHYIEAPLLLRLSLPLGRRKAKWFVNAGPQISYWIGGRGQMRAYEAFGIDQIEEINYRIRFKPETGSNDDLTIEAANRLQFALAVGGGISIPLDRKGNQISVNLRYVRGTTHMAGNESFEVGATGIEEYLGYKYDAFQISTAYLIPVDLLNLRRGKSTFKAKHRK